MKSQLIAIVAAVLVVGCGGPSIHQAAYQGNIEAVKQFIAAGADVNAKSSRNGSTPLHQAAIGDHKEIAELLIAEGTDVNAENVYGWTPLHYTALGGREEILELLIDNGANVNTKDMKGSTPLHSAASGGHKELVELLIATGADLEAKGNGGETPLDWAIKYKRNETADLLRKHGGKYGKIHFAALGGDIEVVKEFLAAGADVNKDVWVEYPGWMNTTPLLLAAGNGHKEIAELLIAKGADVNAMSDRFGGKDKTALDWAVDQDQTETADLLRKHGGKTGEELKAEGK
jgi:ankyrin repeat protein